jgi:ParB family chromosome partitioning protein
MGKVKYRTPSENFERITSKTESSKSRVSIGRENSIGEYYFLSVDSLVPYEKQARYIFDEAEINQLATTIKEHGINNPLLVIVSKTHKEKFEVVSGERRLRAAKLLKMEKVPCIIIEDEKAEEVALIENIQRTDLHPVELGDALKSLLSEANWGSVSKLAEKLGKNQSTVSN